jgi:uncharacterized protein
MPVTLRAVPPRVVDLAGSFSAAEFANLEQAAGALGTQYQMDIVIVTTNDAGGKTPRAFADDFFDFGGYGVGSDYDGILLLVDFDNREVYISTSGSGIRYLTDQRIEKILDAVVAGGLSDGNTYGAALAFLQATGQYLAAGIPSDQNTVEEPAPNTLSLLEVLFSLALSAGVGLAIFTGTRAQYRGKPRPAVFEYRKNSLISFDIAQDSLVRTFVTTRIRPTPQPSSGGSSAGRSTVHRSSSGRTHGGGGRKF